MKSLYEKLVEYQQSDYYPFHMPGHKRNLSFFDTVFEGSQKQSLRLSFLGKREIPIWGSYGVDITEIEGFDNLHNASGILADAMERAAKVCGSKKTFFLVNGSTCGLLAGISACVQHGDSVMIARNCHKAVYHAIELNELTPFYIYPHEVKEYGICGGISPENLREMLITHKNVKLVVVTSPTYEGVVSDIKALADTSHAFGVPLLVDEAHGAHFGHSAFFPKSALSYGADIVIQSTHKTLPAFTQTALLHLGKNSLVSEEQIKKYLGIYQTSSPSYLFMASIDWCMEFLEKRQEKVFGQYEQRLVWFYEKAKELEFMEVFCPVIRQQSFRKNDLKRKGYDIYDFDLAKLNIFVKKGSGLTGSRLYDILLKKYHLQMEMVSKDYVLAMTSLCDTEEGMRRLMEALLEIDRECGKGHFSNLEREKEENEKEESKSLPECMPHNPMKYTPYEVQEKKEVKIPFAQSCGKISKEYVYLYPPGIPLLVPGEEITEELVKKVEAYKMSGLKVCGSGEDGIGVVKQ